VLNVTVLMLIIVLAAQMLLILYHLDIAMNVIVLAKNAMDNWININVVNALIIHFYHIIQLIQNVFHVIILVNHVKGN
jgi:hypothetical protein